MAVNLNDAEEVREHRRERISNRVNRDSDLNSELDQQLEQFVFFAERGDTSFPVHVVESVAHFIREAPGHVAKAVQAAVEDAEKKSRKAEAEQAGRHEPRAGDENKPSKNTTAKKSVKEKEKAHKSTVRKVERAEAKKSNQ